MHILLAAGDLDPSVTINNVRAILIAVISLALLAVTLVGIWLARRGNPGENANIVLAVLIAVIPGALALGGFALAFGAAFLGWAVPGITK